VLVLRDVLGFRTAEVADMLDTGEASVKGALQRVRATLEARLPAADRERAPGPNSAFGRDRSHAEPIRIRMCAFDENPGIRPSARQFVGYPARWEPLPDDGLPRPREGRHAIA
jgi:hypothetical protein